MRSLRPVPHAALAVPLVLIAACGGASPDPETAAHAHGADAPLPGPTLDDDPPTGAAPIAGTLVGPGDGLTASGNEPFWSLRIEPGVLALSRLGEPDLDADDPRVEALPGGGRRYLVSDEGLVVEATSTICRDDMTGMPYPLAVTVAFDDTRLEGCGGDPSTWLAGEWTVTRVGGQPPPPDAAPTIAFDVEAGTVAGSTGCNRFQGTFERTGEGLTLGPLATTRRACPGPAMRVERDFLAIAADVTRFDVDGEGGLVLETADDRQLVAARP